MTGMSYGNSNFCKFCNAPILQINEVDLFGTIAKKENIIRDLKTFVGINLDVDQRKVKAVICRIWNVCNALTSLRREGECEGSGYENVSVTACVAFFNNYSTSTCVSICKF